MSSNHQEERNASCSTLVEASVRLAPQEKPTQTAEASQRCRCLECSALHPLKEAKPLPTGPMRLDRQDHVAPENWWTVPALFVTCVPLPQLWIHEALNSLNEPGLSLHGVFYGWVLPAINVWLAIALLLKKISPSTVKEDSLP